MWANTIDGGLIAIGVEDNGVVSGCERAGSTGTNSLETDARNTCPDAHVEAKRIQATRADGAHDYLLLLRVHYNSRKVVKTSKGDAFIRVGDQKRRLSAEEVRDLEAARGQRDTEQELCPAVSFPDDFNLLLVNDFIQSIRARHPNYPSALTTPELLEFRRLGRRESGRFIPNTACVLLFGKDPTLHFPGLQNPLPSARRRGRGHGNQVERRKRPDRRGADSRFNRGRGRNSPSATPGVQEARHRRQIFAGSGISIRRMVRGHRKRLRTPVVWRPEKHEHFHQDVRRPP